MLTSWQAHGAKLEAVRAEFQTDPQNIRDVLRVWQLHGNSINSFLENDGVEENGGSGRLPSPSSRALDGGPPPLHACTVVWLAPDRQNTKCKDFAATPAICHAEVGLICETLCLQERSGVRLCACR